ncbi:SHOCT domain-containing protein [Candidatus Pelagibacter sp.]|nr:SHOCT domain-containing protein [Candidatus Pelagibacter sp.]
MEKIIFFGLVIPILGFVLYLGATAIMKGFSAKSENKKNESIDDEQIQEFSNNENNISDEIEKLNQLLKDGVLTQDEFEKAKKKILDN